MKKFKIPEKVNISPITFDVKVCELKDPNGNAANGHTSFANLLIRVANDMVEEKRNLTFCHELVHAMCEVAGLNANRTKKQKEELAANLAPVLYSVLKDNNFK